MNKNYISWFKINNSTHLFLSTFNHLSLAGLLVVTSSAFGQSASEEVKQTKQQDDVVQFPALSVVGNLNSSVGAGSSVLKLKDIERTQANNLAELVDQLPGISLIRFTTPRWTNPKYLGYGRCGRCQSDP